VRQRALAALHDHFRGSTTQGILGFLVGALLEDPSTRERWLELEFIVRLTQPIYGDKTTLVISRVWERLQQEVGRTGGHMLGSTATPRSAPRSRRETSKRTSSTSGARGRSRSCWA
jgi:hypothetical protein